MIDEKKLIERFKQLKGSDSLANMFITDVIKEIQKQPKVDWIPCSERLPENIKTVIVDVKEIKNPTFAWYSNLDNIWHLLERDFLNLADFHIIAWQPLPEPYKEAGAE